MEILVRWTRPRCQGEYPLTCGLCEKTGYLESWMPWRLSREAEITGGSSLVAMGREINFDSRAETDTSFTTP